MNCELCFCSEALVWQEVPNETSLAFLCSGCPLRCAGCHSASAWSAHVGKPLTPEYLQERLKRYQGLMTCVLFMGGEWQPYALLALLKVVREFGLRSCLYTGLTLDELQQQAGFLLPYLHYVKTGRWVAELGGLESPITNQRFIELSSGKVLNHLFVSALESMSA